MLQFSIGLSALQTAQQGLAIAGNNLANASTPGYHRQIAQLTSNSSTQYGSVTVGSGVSVGSINRVVSDQLDAAITQQTSASGFIDTSLTTSTQIEQTISPGLTSPATQIENLINKLQELSATPANGAARQAAVTSAANVASSFNSAASDLSQIQNGLDSSISSTVSQINALSKQIAGLNDQISSLSNQGVSPNDLLDQRGQLINNLAQFAGVQVQSSDNNQVLVIVSGAALVAGNQFTTLTAGKDHSGVAIITATGLTSPLSITSGQLGGQLDQRNHTLADIQDRLDTLAQQVAASFNGIQATGLGNSGGLTQLIGQNGVSDATTILSSAGLSFPPKAGSLFIGVTDSSTGVRTVTEIPIDPSTQSLTDVATEISNAVPSIQAFVNSQTGTLSLLAAPGTSFDFAGGFNKEPATNFTTTTSVPTIGGSLKSTSNDQYTFTFNATGTVGVTPNLEINVTNAAGNVVDTVSVGPGYQPGKPITLSNGLTVTLSAGDVAQDDSFSTPISGNPDSAGLLNSLGLNTLFTGDSAATLKLNTQISDDPNRLATSTTGLQGDVSNLQRFVALGDASVLNQGTQTFSQFANSMVSDIGTDVQSLTTQQTTNQTLMTNLTTQQQSVSGVDANEELANVLQYQQMFALAGKYISAVNDTLNSLVTMIN